MVEYILIEKEKSSRDSYISIIEELMTKYKIDYQINEYSKYTKELKRKIEQKEHYKIYILGISIEGQVSGIDIGKYIRKNDLNSEIIFITEHDSMFESVFRTIPKVYNFIEKFQNSNERLKSSINDIMKEYIQNNYFFPLDKKEKKLLSLDEILYIYRETVERKVYIVTNNTKYSISIPLNIALNYCNPSFKQIHRGCIVNTDKVKMYNWKDNYFILNNNTKIFMCSKKYRKNIV